MTDRSHWQPWSEFAEAVRTGHSQTREVLGAGIFEYLQQNPQEAVSFTGAMAGLTGPWTDEVVDQLDTSTVTVAIDIGGADGAFLHRLQQNDPALRGIAFDRPDVAAAVPDNLLGDRVEAVGGDFFDAVPVGDLYLLKLVLHDWDDGSCVKILTRCREAMNPGARVAIVEFLIGAPDDPGPMALMDLNMLAMATGKERTVAECDVSLAQAGLRRAVVHTTESPLVIIEAIAA